MPQNKKVGIDSNTAKALANVIMRAPGLGRCAAADIKRIVKRADALGLVRGKKRPDHWYLPETMFIDLAVCHRSCVKLDFKRWLEADDFNFIHDVAGIAKHMDRNTGELTDCFMPRFQLREQAA